MGQPLSGYGVLQIATKVLLCLFVASRSRIFLLEMKLSDNEPIVITQLQEGNNTRSPKPDRIHHCDC